MEYNKIIKAKKSLGQNFLKSKSVLNRIILEGEISKKDTVLEIGPGKGALTEKLLEYAGYVLAIEKDRELVEFLKEKFSKEIKSKKLILIEGDCLKFELSDNPYKLIANIPYNITGAILKKFLSESIQPERMVLLVQKEVCDRIVAQKESILSISVKAYGTPRYMMKVDKKLFSPSPKVNSAILSIKNISKKNFKILEEEKFFEILKLGFSHKRKVLISNLSKLSNKIELEKIFKDLNIDTKTRAENIQTDVWLALAQKMSTQ